MAGIIVMPQYGMVVASRCCCLIPEMCDIVVLSSYIKVVASQSCHLVSNKM